MSFHRKRKRWAGPALDPAKSLEIWKARHPHEDIPFAPAPNVPSLPAIDPETPRSRIRWPGQRDSAPERITGTPTSGKAPIEDAVPPLPFQNREDQGDTVPQERILGTDNPFTHPPRVEHGTTDPDARTDGTVSEPSGDQSTTPALPGTVVSRPRSLVMRLIRFAARFFRKPRSRTGRQAPLPPPSSTKGLGEQVDDFVELLTSGNSLPTAHREKLLMALRGGLESGHEEVPSEAFPYQETKAAEIPPVPASTPIATPDPSPVGEAIVPDPTVELQRQQELQAKDRQIEILEVKVRRLAAMLKERERRNAEAMEQAARNRSRLPGMSRLQRKSSAQSKEGASELMLGIRELNRQIREEIQSLYASGTMDPNAAMTPAEEPVKPAD